MNDDNDRALAQAIALSLQHVDKEEEDIKVAIAASLGKTVEQLTPRELLTATINTDNKRSREENNSGTGTSSRKRMQPSTDLNQYWDGTVKLTHITGFTGPDYVKFEDIVQKNTLKKACITAFVCSLEYVNEHFPESVNMCIVMHGRPATMAQIRPTRLIIHPPMKDPKYGVFHPKLMLLVHEDRIRIVIGSANLERYDYNELENVVFIQDFPKLAVSLKKASELPRFARDLYDILERMHVPRSVGEELLDYDFSKAKAHIVASVSGVFEGEEECRKFGHTRVGEVVREIGANDPQRPPRIEMQTSSLGSLNPVYLKELYNSFSGKTPQEAAKRSTESLPLPMEVVFPSRDTVSNSRTGPEGGGTIFLDRKAWEKPTFPKDLLRDAVSHREGTLMHSKYIIASLPKKENAIQGWVYCGSHNATRAAWGKVTLDRKTKQPKMTISNWELGVVLPIEDDKTHIPAPYLRPPPNYPPGEIPWMQESFFD